MIKNAKDITARDNPDLPDVSDAVMTLLRHVKIGIVHKSTVEGYTQEITEWRNVLACRQAMPETLAIRKEGERSWRWSVIYVTPDVLLSTDDMVIFDKVKYRIMEKENWAEYGFLRYNAIEDYVASRAE